MPDWKYGDVVTDDGVRMMVVGKKIDPTYHTHDDLGGVDDWIGVVLRSGKMTSYYTTLGVVEYMPDPEHSAWNWKKVRR